MWYLVLAEEGHGAASAGPMDFRYLPAITGLVVFLVAFGFLYVKVWPMITKGLDEREAKIREAIEEAEAARQQARRALNEYEESLADARREADKMIIEAKASAKALTARLREKSEAELTEMKQRARREIESATQSAIADLHSEAAMLATSIAARILRREISSDDQQRLVDESLQEFGRVSAH